MKRIGLLGGMSWESSLEYYRILNEETQKILGSSHSANCIMYSFDFNEIESLQHENKWDQLTERMNREAVNLKKAGAEFLIICTNTMHLMAQSIEETSGLKVLHIADATGQAISKTGLKKVGLLGTKFTMEGTFYSNILRDNHHIETIIPNAHDRELIHNIIYNELILGKFKDESRKIYQDVIERLRSSGAEGVILGCTEIPLLIKQEHSLIPVFDTTSIHAKAALAYSLDSNS